MGWKKFFKGFTILVLIGLIIFTGCSKIEPVAVVKEKNELLKVSGVIPSTLEVSSDLTLREEDIICALFDGLVEITDTGVVGTSIAKGWKVSEDGLTYSLLISDDAYWSDGEPIDADDYLDFFAEILSPQNSKYESEELYSIFGVEEYRDGIRGFDEVGISSTDKNEINFRLTYKDDNFLKKLSKPEYRLRDLDNDLVGYLDSYSEIRYTGAYKILSIDESKIKLAKNDKYNTSFDGAKEIEILKSTDYINDFAMYNTGKLDIVYNPPKSAFEDGRLLSKIDVGSSSVIDYLVFNEKSNSGKFLDFRKAMYLALSGTLDESYMVKNNLAKIETREITKDEIEEDVFFIKEFEDYTVGANQNSMQLAMTYIETIPEVKEKEITVIGLSSFENKSLETYFNKVFDSLGLKLNFKLYSEEELDILVENGKFDILINSVDLTKSSIGKDNEVIVSNSEELEFIFISLYRRNNYWCRSENVKNTYIDKNGNLIFKKTMFIG